MGDNVPPGVFQVLLQVHYRPVPLSHGDDSGGASDHRGRHLRSGTGLDDCRQDAWIGKDAVLGDDSSLYGVRFDPLATSIKYEQMNSCGNVEEVIIHEGIRDIQSYGICALRASVIEIPSSVDFMDYKAFSNDYFDEMIFKNPEGWMIDGEAIDSEIL